MPTWGAFVEKGGKALSKIASGDLSGAAAELFGAAAAPSVSMTTEEQAKQVDEGEGRTQGHEATVIPQGHAM